MVDEASQQRFLVNTGSSYSIIPHKSREPQSGLCLCTADRSQIACWGTRKMHVAAGGSRFKWDFLLEDMVLPIIGANFLQHFVLLVDLGEMRILACRGDWRQHLVQQSGSGMFATIGVVADQPPQVCAGKKHHHVGAVQPPSSLPRLEARSSASRPSVEVPSSSSSLQHMLENFPVCSTGLRCCPSLRTACSTSW